MTEGRILRSVVIRNKNRNKNRNNDCGKDRNKNKKEKMSDCEEIKKQIIE